MNVECISCLHYGCEQVVSYVLLMGLLLYVSAFCSVVFTYSSLNSSSLMGFWPTTNALARHVVDRFFIRGVLPVVF